MFTYLLLSSSIYAPNETAEKVVLAIESTLEEKGQFLGKLIDICCSWFGITDVHSIPPGNILELSKLAEGETITTDTYNAARRLIGYCVKK